MDDFEQMLQTERVSLERFVRYRLPSREDADDVLQEIYLSAYQKFPQLKNKASFKAWLLVIARNKCNDYFRRKAAQLEIPVDELTETGRDFLREVMYRKHWICWGIRTNRFFTCISGRKCPRQKLPKS